MNIRASQLNSTNNRHGRGFVTLFALLGIFVYLLRAVGYFSSVPGDIGDARFNSVILEHVYLWLCGDVPSLWSPEFFYPYPDALAFSDNHFGTAWIYALMRISGLTREVAFDAWYCIGSLSTYAAAVYATRKLGFGWFAAATAGFVFAYSLPMLVQEGHAQLIYRYGIPLAMLEFWRVLVSRQLTRLPQVACWTALQFFCSIYLGLFLLFLLGAMLASAVLTRLPRVVDATSPTRRGRLIAMWLLAVGLWLLVLAMLAKYQHVAHEYGFIRSKEEIMSMLPRLGSYLIDDRSLATGWIGSWIQDIPMRNEHQLFFGLAVLTLALIGLAVGLRCARWRPHTRLFALTLLILCACSLSVHDHSIYRLLLALPGFNSIRAVTRIVLVMLLPMAILAAIGAETLERRSKRLGLFVPVAIALLLTIEVYFYQPISAPISAWRQRIADLDKVAANSMQRRNPIALVLSKDHELWIFSEIDAMVWAQDRRIPTLNGYSGNAPPGFQPALDCSAVPQRLNAYVVMKHLSPASYTELLQRVEILPKWNCPSYTQLRPFEGALTETTYASTRLALSPLRKVAHGYELTITISNQGNSYLPALSTSNQPVLLSWQFVPEGGQAQPAAWNTRALLSHDVAVHASMQEVLQIAPPTKPGRYRLVVSLVQEGVAWFHDRGMPLAIEEQPLTVAADTIFKNLSLTVVDPVIEPDGSLTAKVHIVNASPLVLPSMRGSRTPMRLSWRFVPMANAAVPGWDPRQDLFQDVAANGGTSTEIIHAQAPKAPGTYNLEVSLVQESVAWLHDLGGHPATALQRIVVADDGKTSVQPTDTSKR